MSYLRAGLGLAALFVGSATMLACPPIVMTADPACGDGCAGGAGGGAPSSSVSSSGDGTGQGGAGGGAGGAGASGGSGGSGAGGGTGGSGGSVCGAEPTPLVTGLVSAFVLALDATHVYWTDAATHEVGKTPLTGGTPQVLAVGNWTNSYGIAVGAENVYWTAMDGGVRAVPKNGGTPTLLAQGQGFPDDVVLDAKGIYYGGVDAIMTIPYGGPPAVVAVTDPWADPLTLDANNLYWISPAVSPFILRTAPKTGGAVTDLATADGYVVDIAANATDVYWTTQSGSLQMVSKQGSSAVTLASHVEYEAAWKVVLDDTHVYWSHFAGVILRMPLGGGPEEVVVANQPGMQDVAVDANCVYWSNVDDGTIMAMAK